MMPLRYSAFNKLPYENQIILLITALAFIRVAVGVILDFLQNTVFAAELALDICFLIIFGAVFLYTGRGQVIRFVSPFLGLALIILLGLNFYQFGGTNGFSEYNYLSGFLVTIMLFSGSWLTRFVLFQLAFIIALVVLHRVYPGPINRTFLVAITDDPTDFLFALFSILLLTYYLKRITKIEILKVGALNKLLSEKALQAKRQNHLLIERGNELKAARENLETQIRERISHLTLQNTALENYIEYNTTDLVEPLERLMVVANNLETKSPLIEMTAISCNDLSKVIKSIKSSLESDGVVNRSSVG